MSVDFTLCS